jgi:hypothetical protein
MKKLFSMIVIVALTTTLAQAQDKTNFDLTKDGVKPITVKLSGMSAKVIYQKTMDWVKENYNNPKEVIKSNIENKTILIESFKEKAWYYMGFGFKNEFGMDYAFQIDMKENKATLTFTPKQFWNEKEKAPFSYDMFFDYTGKVDWQYKDAKPSMDKTMNDIGTSLLTYLKAAKK